MPATHGDPQAKKTRNTLERLWHLRPSETSHSCTDVASQECTIHSSIPEDLTNNPKPKSQKHRPALGVFPAAPPSRGGGDPRPVVCQAETQRDARDSRSDGVEGGLSGRWERPHPHELLPRCSHMCPEATRSRPSGPGRRRRFPLRLLLLFQPTLGAPGFPGALSQDDPLGAHSTRATAHL